MEQKNTHLMYGLLTGVGTVVVMAILHFANLDEKPIVGWLAYIPFLLGMILNSMAFSKANDGYVTFKSTFGSNFKATMIVTIIMIAWTVISMYMFPEMKEKAMELAHAEMIKKPNMTDEMVDKAMSLMRKGYGTILISSALFGSLFLGSIFSLLGAAIPPKKGEKPFNDNL